MIKSSKSPEKAVYASASPADELAKMRARMIELHGLSSIVVSEKLSPVKKQALGASEKVVIPFTSSEMTEQRFADDGVNAICDDGNTESPNADFISRLSHQNRIKPDSDRLDTDVYVALPFGMVRFDSMNKPQNNDNGRSVTGPVYAMDVEDSDDDNVFEGSNVHQVSRSSIKKVITQKYTAGLSQLSDVCKSDDITLHLSKSAGINKGSSVKTPGDMTERVISRSKLPGQKMHSCDSSVIGNAPAADCEPVSYADQSEMNLFDQQYFTSHLPFEINVEQDVKQEKEARSIGTSEHNVFDQEYFGSQLNNEKKTEKDANVLGATPSNIFEEQYFAGSSGNPPPDLVDVALLQNSSVGDLSADLSAVNLPMSNMNSSSHNQAVNNVSGKFCDRSKQHEKSARSVHSPGLTLNVRGFAPQQSSHYSPQTIGTDADLMVSEAGDDRDEGTVFVEPMTQREYKSHTRPMADVKNPKTAYDLAMKLRLERQRKLTVDKTSTQPESGGKKSAMVDPKQSKWTGRVDSKGFRILQDQVVDINHLTQDDLVSILKDSVIYEDDKLFVIDKPYGLPSHGGPGVHTSVGQLLEPLAVRVDRSSPERLRGLHLVHRLDKETTGVMILAKSQQVAEFLLAMFKKRQVLKHYWVITKGIPNPTEGVIDIPLGEGIVGNRYRMELRPIFSADGHVNRHVAASMDGRSEAVTNYRVLSSYGSAALVECTPETGVKHQIRCHLAFGLNTPILGDHKYSHYSKMAPQKLHPEILQMLNVRQTKVRHIPMHLHAKAVVLPEWIDGRNLFLSSRLPKHFVQNMKWLRLKPPS